MIVSVHQPEFMPWLNFFDKLDRSDIFILLDDVQFRKNYYHNRCNIRSRKEAVLLTVPVKSGPLKRNINETRIVQENWNRKIWKSIVQNYKKAKYFHKYEEKFYEIFMKTWDNISDLNSSLIKLLASLLGIETNIQISSKLSIKKSTDPTERLVDICRFFGAVKYISGKFGINYLNLESFQKNGIEVILQDYTYPAYRQVYEPFISGLSVIDLLLNEGDLSLQILRKGRKDII